MKEVRIDYTNWRGERSSRLIVPNRVRYGSDRWHPEERWLLDALDVAKGELRTFAMGQIHSWREGGDTGEAALRREVEGKIVEIIRGGGSFHSNGDGIGSMDPPTLKLLLADIDRCLGDGNTKETG